MQDILLPNDYKSQVLTLNDFYFPFVNKGVDFMYLIFLFYLHGAKLN